MTLEKLRKLIYDIFAYETEGESSELYTEAFDLLESSMIIPKPKFEVGDRVRWSNAPEDIIEERLYNPDANMWGYLRSDMITFIDEDELELVEEKK